MQQLFRAPRSLPALSVLIEASAHRPEALARYLGVSPRTFARWRARGAAPRPIELALYWESFYGVQHIEADAFNAARQSAAEAAAWKRECERLAGVVARLETEYDWGSANAPVYAV
ncbi:helix-turn-helix transcriptional regulator [Variovorax sp. RCC_210]|uniref:helix-turn-helix transcriptional regulator n=1 Tax=Variovorax sp. RCC_210 TaxID=3239217 RepID=UPI0035269EF8